MEKQKLSSHRTLVILKPEVFENDLIGPVFQAFLDAQLIPIAMEMKHPTKEQMLYHYRDVFQKYGDKIGNDIIERMTRGNSIFIIFTDRREYSDPLDFILMVRKLIGATDPKKAEPGTIRARFAKEINYNMVHASDSLESAADETKFWFPNL